MSCYVTTVKRRGASGRLCVVRVLVCHHSRLSPASVNSKRTKRCTVLLFSAIEAHRCSSVSQPVSQTHKQPRLPRRCVCISAKTDIAVFEATQSHRLSRRMGIFSVLVKVLKGEEALCRTNVSTVCIGTVGKQSGRRLSGLARKSRAR